MAQQQTEEIRKLITTRGELAEKGDYFGVLGLPEGAPVADVRASYFALVKQLHPDRLGQIGLASMQKEAARLFHTMTQAHETLSDPKRREEYVQLRARGGGPMTATARVAAANEEAAKIAAHKGSVMMKKADFAEAENFFREACAARPDVARYWQSLGWAIFHNEERPEDNRLDEAARCYEKALQIDAEDAQTHYSVALLWKAKGEQTKARRALEKAIAAKADFIEAKRELRLMDMRSRKGTDPVGRVAPSGGGGLLDKIKQAFKKR